jgi:hypothetical protein
MPLLVLLAPAFHAAIELGPGFGRHAAIAAVSLDELGKLGSGWSANHSANVS